MPLGMNEEVDLVVLTLSATMDSMEAACDAAARAATESLRILKMRKEAKQRSTNSRPL